MRYVRIFLLHAQEVFENRSTSFVWFILPLINGGFFLVFWQGAFRSNKHLLSGWDGNSLITYYLLILIAATLLISHVEEPMERDIAQGSIIKYLLRPFSYYWFMLIGELPNRLLQGSYAIMTYTLIAFAFPSVRIHVPDIFTFLLLIGIFACAFFLIHTYKMILGMIGFWTKDTKGFTETSEVIMII